MKRDALPAADQAFHLLDEAVDCSSADETEAVLIAGAAGLTRFADSRIHQNVVGENVELLLRVPVGGRVAGFRTNRLSEANVKAAVERAAEIARQTPADPDFPGRPGPADGPLAGGGGGGGVWGGGCARRGPLHFAGPGGLRPPLTRGPGLRGAAGGGERVRADRGRRSGPPGPGRPGPPRGRAGAA